MLVLNLGCGDPHERSWHPIAGADNRDKSLGWRFEDGLHDLADGSVDGITCSHTLMYVALADWPTVFAEFARVLRDGGVLRVTEDNVADTRSRTHPRGWRDALALTNPEMTKAHMLAAGLVPHDVEPHQTMFGADILIQRVHGEPPHVFFCEGVRMKRVLFSPHSDDETLFAAFTILRYRPHVVICFGSAGDYGSTEERAAESRAAGDILGAASVSQWDGGDIEARMREYDAAEHPSLVFAPTTRTSHPDHLAVARAAAAVFGDRLRTFHTYELRDGVPVKIDSVHRVEYEPEWVLAKLRALSRYETQIRHPRACGFFLQDMNEYMGEPTSK